MASAGSNPAAIDGMVISTSSQSYVWTKTNLRPGERTAWTRGRDGWSGVGNDAGVRSVSLADDSSLHSSNLCFSLTRTPTIAVI